MLKKKKRKSNRIKTDGAPAEYGVATDESGNEGSSNIEQSHGDLERKLRDRIEHAEEEVEPQDPDSADEGTQKSVVPDGMATQEAATPVEADGEVPVIAPSEPEPEETGGDSDPSDEAAGEEGFLVPPSPLKSILKKEGDQRKKPRARLSFAEKPDVMDESQRKDPPDPVKLAAVNNFQTLMEEVPSGAKQHKKKKSKKSKSKKSKSRKPVPAQVSSAATVTRDDSPSKKWNAGGTQFNKRVKNGISTVANPLYDPRLVELRNHIEQIKEKWKLAKGEKAILDLSRKELTSVPQIVCKQEFLNVLNLYMNQIKFLPHEIGTLPSACRSIILIQLRFPCLCVPLPLLTTVKVASRTLYTSA